MKAVDAHLRPGQVTPEAVIIGADAERLPNTTLFTVPGLKADKAPGRPRR